MDQVLQGDALIDYPMIPELTFSVSCHLNFTAKTMGLDITIGFDIHEDENDDNEPGNDEWRSYQHELSRTFCNFMCRKGVVEGTAELDQIAESANIDVSMLYHMMNYTTAYDIEEYLEFNDDLTEEALRSQAHETNALVEGNIPGLIVMLEALITYLDDQKDLSQQLDTHGFDTLGADYFKNLDTPEIGNYIDNNLKQDLKSLCRSAAFGESLGAKTIYFVFV